MNNFIINEVTQTKMTNMTWILLYVDISFQFFNRITTIYIVTEVMYSVRAWGELPK